MQTTFGVNAVALVDNVPRTLPLRSIIHNYVQHQREVIVRRSKFRLRKLEARKHILEGQLIALDHLDEVIALIRGARDRDTARTGLIERFGLTYIQAQAILELRLQQLTALESDAIRREHADIVEQIAELRALLGDEDRVLGLIKEELTEIRDRYGDERRTQITYAEDDLDIEDLIADQQMVITITKSGYIKSIPLATYRQQRRGGVGVTGMGMKDEDYIEHLFVCSTHDYLLFFTNRGKVYRSKVYDLPDAPSRQSKGRHLGNVLPLREGERVQSVLATRDYAEVGVPRLRHPRRHRQEDRVRALQHADQGRRHHRDQHPRRRRAGRRAARRPGRRDPHGLARGPRRALLGGGRPRAWAATRAACAAWTSAATDNHVLAMDVARPGQDLLVVTENGYGKRTSIDEYRKTSRGAKGVKTIQQTEAKGALAGALVVREHQELVFISQNGMVQRISVRGINRYGRSSQGVRLMNLRPDDVVSAVALVVESEAAATARAARRCRSRSPPTATPTSRQAVEADGIVPADPDEDELLDIPEVVEDDGMPDTDLEE